MNGISNPTGPPQSPGGRSQRFRGRGRWSLEIVPSLLLPVLLSCSGSEGPSAPAGPGSLSAVEGTILRAPAGTVIPGGPTLRLLDTDGDPIGGATIQVTVVEGGGKLAATSVETDSQGRAPVIWVLGRGVGEPQRLRADYGALTAEITAQGLAATPGSTFQGRESYVEYRPGTLPLVLTAPHGGSLEPLEIPDRGWGTTVQDRNTRELVLAIRDELFHRTGAYPHVILSNLHRKKLDPNREIVEAAQGSPEADRAWWEFHAFSDEAGALVEDAFGEGLHLDIHGHGHEIDRVELGYLLSRTDLAQPDGSLSSLAYVDKTSLRALAKNPGNELADLVRGPKSLGALLEQGSYSAVPSVTQPDPGEDDYFTGGYITERHGSRDGGAVSAIQLEHHFPGLRDEEEDRQRYAEALVNALLVYFPAHFGFELSPAPPVVGPPLGS